MDRVFEKTTERMEKALDALERDFSTIRAGRANPNVLNNVVVEYYGTPTPLNQMAAVSVPEPRMLNPQNDGKVIRLTFPQLTEEHRKALVKDVSKRGEEAKVAIRNVRRDSMDDLKKLKKDNEITEDDQKDGEKKLQDITDKYIKNVEEMTKKKETEILSI